MKMIKKKLLTFVKQFRVAISIFSALLLIAVYLNTASNHFYHHLHTAGLVWPQYQSSYTVGSPAETELSYVALGDSLTSGVGAETFDKSYSYLVAQQIVKPDQSITLTTESYPGYKAIDLINHNLDATVKLQPDIVTILIGGNDVHGFGPSANEFRANYETLIRRIHTETKADIFAISIPYIGKNSLIWPPYKNYYSARTITFNSIIKDLSTKYGIHYIDLYTPTLPYANASSHYYSKDDFHPSPDGYALWAGVIARAINQ